MPEKPGSTSGVAFSKLSLDVPQKDTPEIIHAESVSSGRKSFFESQLGFNYFFLFLFFPESSVCCTKLGRCREDIWFIIVQLVISTIKFTVYALHICHCLSLLLIVSESFLLLLNLHLIHFFLWRNISLSNSAAQIKVVLLCSKVFLLIHPKLNRNYERILRRYYRNNSDKGALHQVSVSLPKGCVFFLHWVGRMVKSDIKQEEEILLLFHL